MPAAFTTTPGCPCGGCVLSCRLVGLGRGAAGRQPLPRPRWRRLVLVREPARTAAATRAGATATNAAGWRQRRRRARRAGAAHAAWFRLELERFRDQAIDQPTPENVRAYLYLQKVMLDKADAFARTSQQVASADPYLDAITERPLSPFAANATSAEATARRGETLRELASSTGLLFVVDSRCGVCVRAADVLLSAQRQYGFTLLTVSLDGKAPSGLELPVRPDTGQAKKLGVVGTPALFLMRPPDAILPLAQGALDLDTLTARVVDQAHAAGWVDEAAYAATRAVRQPFAVPEPDSLASTDLSTPERIVTSLRQQLGLPAALTPALPEGDLP